MNDQTTTPPTDDDATKPTVKVNQDTCIGCGVCTSIAPEVFELRDDGKSHVKDQDDASADLSAEILAKAEEAKGACPVGAITVE